MHVYVQGLLSCRADCRFVDRLKHSVYINCKRSELDVNHGSGGWDLMTLVLVLVSAS